MEYIYDWLKQNKDYYITDSLVADNTGFTHIYFYNAPHNYVGCVTAPHRGNDFHFLLRMNDACAFDRWGNVNYEKSLLTANEVIMLLDEGDPWI